MGKERYSILFSSMTGNTKELADAIREILPEETLDYFGLCKDADPQSEILYIGFWTDKGTADEATTTLLKSLRNKKIFLFGTAGFGGSEEYYQKVLHNVRENIDPSNQIVGEYMCQGALRSSGFFSVLSSLLPYDFFLPFSCDFPVVFCRYRFFTGRQRACLFRAFFAAHLFFPGCLPKRGPTPCASPRRKPVSSAYKLRLLCASK